MNTSNMSRPRVEDETDHWYVDKLTGRRVSFHAKADEAVVTFSGRAHADIVRKLADAAPILSVSQGANLKRGFAAVYVRPDHHARDTTQVDEIANALPVMVDNEGLPRYFLPDELTVQFKDNVDLSRAEELIQQLGARISCRQRTRGYYTLLAPDGKGLFSVIREFADLPEIAFAEPSEAGFNDLLTRIPDDPDFPQLWGLRNTGQIVNGTAGAAGIDICASEAWDLHRGDPDVIIAVVDTGADLDHPDLQANILPQNGEDWDFADTGDPIPEDEFGHGTHVAGTAAAADNTVGIIGVAPKCRIMPLRVDLQAGLDQNRADAINYVVGQAALHANRRYVVNCSWKASGDHAGIRNAVINAVNCNIVVIFSAGNNNQNTDVVPQYPGVYPQVIAVAALDQNGMKAAFSNFGSSVDVCAPGVNIYSTLPGDTYGFAAGTSMAAPHVTGLAALILSSAPCLSNEKVRQIIEDTCESVDTLNPGFAGQLGKGRVNAFRAVSLAQSTAASHSRHIMGP